jgi:hypothetical protein
MGKTSFSSTFSFDADDFLNRDANGNILELEDPLSSNKKAHMFKPEFKNLHNFVDKTQKMEGAIIVSGSPKDYPSGVPDKTDDKVKASLAQLNSDLDEHIKTFLAYSKQLTPTRLKARPAGNVSFNPIASGNENYHVYHISFSRGYAEKYAGSEKKKKEHPEYEKGITVFIPLEKAGETRIGAASLRGTHISNTEAAINMSPDNTYRFSIPGGGAIEVSKIGDSAYTVIGNLVEYNLQNGTYDTIPINPNKVEIKSSLELDMDGHIKENVDSLISNLVHNRTKLNYIRSQIGVTAHAKPVTSKEKKVWTKAEIQALDKTQRKSMKEWGDYGAMASTRKYIDPNQAARVISFDAKTTNFDRYRSSPCYNTLGFSPLGDLKEQENRYLKCEEVYYKKRNKNIVLYLGMFLILASIVYIGIRKRK